MQGLICIIKFLFLPSESTHWAFGKNFRKTNIPHVTYCPIYHMWYIDFMLCQYTTCDILANIPHVTYWPIYHMWYIGFSELSCMTSLWYNNVNVALVTRRYWKIYQLVVIYFPISSRDQCYIISIGSFQLWNWRLLIGPWILNKMPTEKVL